MDKLSEIHAGGCWSCASLVVSGSLGSRISTMTTTKVTKLTKLELAVDYHWFQILPQEVGTPAAVMWGEMAWCSTAVADSIKGAWNSAVEKWCSHHSHFGLQEKVHYFISKGFTIWWVTSYQKYFFLKNYWLQLKPDQRALPSLPFLISHNARRPEIHRQDKTLKIWDFPSMQRADASELLTLGYGPVWLLDVVGYCYSFWIFWVGPCRGPMAGWAW